MILMKHTSLITSFLADYMLFKMYFSENSFSIGENRHFSNDHMAIMQEACEVYNDGGFCVVADVLHLASRHR